MKPNVMRLSQEVKDRLAEEIFQIFQREDLTLGNAWSVCDELRSRLHDQAYSNKLN